MTRHGGRAAGRPLAALVAAVALALLAGCTGGGHSTSQAGTAPRTGAAGTTSGSAAAKAAPRVTITPGNGA